MERHHLEKILGLDLGPNSIGWAIVEKNGDAGKITNAGVRIFPAGLDDLETDGKGKSRNASRRDARSIRRNLDRRARRLAKLAVILSRAGLLPEGDIGNSINRHTIINELDTRFDNPYKLRARALHERLEPFEVGRALYHLAQRRGFQSNRKAQPKDDDERSKVYSGIGELRRAIDKSGAATLGEYFAKLNPREMRIRGRYTHRQMYIDEFGKIWDSQRKHLPELLTDSVRKSVYKAIFDQRPLKSVVHLIGKCTLENNRRRAPWSCLEAQRFRYLQRVNDLKIIDQDSGEIRVLTADEREKVVALCESNEKVTFASLRTKRNLGKNIAFNLEAGGEKHLPGNKTNARIIKCIGADKWLSFSDYEQRGILNELHNIEKDETLLKRLMTVWHLDEEEAKSLAQYKEEKGYGGFSRRALRNLMPLLEKGLPLATAIAEAYPQKSIKTDPLDSLPRIDDSGMQGLRNPIVTRTLSEVRRVINAVVQRYGKPDIIRVELARQIRQTAKQRENTVKKNRANEKMREGARKRLEDSGYIDPGNTDILKVILADECNWTCPYTGKKIELSELVGSSPQFDIEHIIPFDRCLDNSFVNKTLCDAEENRKVKKKQTPYEAYSKSSKWTNIKRRVSEFNGPVGHAKLKRFMMNEHDVAELMSNFTTRQLNDTRWASRWAKKYLGLLYGGVNDDGIDASGKRRVFTSTGELTAKLRQVWGLNGILGDDDIKSRDDHRHHAVDAIITALVENSAIKKLGDAARRGADKNRLLEAVAPPMPDLRPQAEKLILEVIPSHRISRRVRGPLHRDTFYSVRKDEDGRQYGYVRKALADLTSAEIKDKIVDARVVKAVRDKLTELGGNPRIAFASAENHPVLTDKEGVARPIHRVTIRSRLEEVVEVGSGHRKRWVKSETTHHMAVYEVLDETGKVVKWDGEVVSMLEAYRRRRAGEPIVERNHGQKTRFLFSLGSRDIIELDCDGGGRRLFVVRTIPQSKQIYFVPLHDARVLKEIGKAGLTALPNTLLQRKCKKVTVNYLGEVRDAAD